MQNNEFDSFLLEIVLLYYELDIQKGGYYIIEKVFHINIDKVCHYLMHYL
jgi:hypothetical protein